MIRPLPRTLFALNLPWPSLLFASFRTGGVRAMIGPRTSRSLFPLPDEWVGQGTGCPGWGGRGRGGAPGRRPASAECQGAGGEARAKGTGRGRRGVEIRFHPPPPNILLSKKYNLQGVDIGPSTSPNPESLWKKTLARIKTSVKVRVRVDGAD